MLVIFRLDSFLTLTLSGSGQPGNFDRAIAAGNFHHAEPSFPEVVTSLLDAYV